MSEKRPLCDYDGALELLRTEDTLPGLGGASDFLSDLINDPIVITSSTTLTISRCHAISTSASAVMYLPNPTTLSKKFLAVRVSDSVPGLIQLDAGSGYTIDGSQTRILCPGEVVVLVCYNSTWYKIKGRSKSVSVSKYSGTCPTNTQGTFTQVTGFSTDNNSVTNFVNGDAIVVKRPGMYRVSFLAMDTAPNADGTLGAYVYVNGSINTRLFSKGVSISGKAAVAGSSALISLAYNDELKLYIKQDYTTDAGIQYCHLDVEEVSPW